MPEQARIGLDNAAFSGRLRQASATAAPAYATRPIQRRLVNPRPETRPPVQNNTGLAPTPLQPPTLPFSQSQPAATKPKPQAALQPEPVAVPVPVRIQAPEPAPAYVEPQPIVAPTFAAPQPAPFKIVAAQPFAEPAMPKTQRSEVLRRESVRSPTIEYAEPAPFGLKEFLQDLTEMIGSTAQSATAQVSKRLHIKLPQTKYSRLQMSVFGMACLVFVFGVVVSTQTARTNHAAAAQIKAVSKAVDAGASTSDLQSSSAPSTTPVSARAVSQYFVAPDLARYLKIPKLGVNARVLQVGIKSDGELGTPNNVFDTAWYTGSSKPGQPGATLIDGHVSSWTTHGVFYGIKTLVPGDTMQIVRGDGVVLNYRVVKTQQYDSGNVDMQAAINPITPGKSGLNLITCTGQVKRGTSEFNQRVLVFAEQI